MQGSLAIVFSRLLLFALCVLGPARALADGMVIPRIAYAVPTIPDQQALIHFINGTETLVVETSFVGEGTNFAWIVPLPAAPKIEPVSSGLFPTLQTIFQPKVVLSVPHYWVALPVAALVLWLVNVARENSFWALLVLGLWVLFALMLAPAFLPALSRGAAGVNGPNVAQVRVVQRQTAGLFDTVTLQSTEPAALFRWLNANGFDAPTNIAPAVTSYVHDGWVFVAARLNSAAQPSGPQATHPLAFTFPTVKPAYPLRLTRHATSSCRVDLYVFGPSQAAVPGFSVQRCEAPQYGSGNVRVRLEAGELRIRHPELSKIAAGAPVATKLSAVLDAAGMQQDAYVGWEQSRPAGQKAYTRKAAAIFSGNVAALLTALLLVAQWAASLAPRVWKMVPPLWAKQLVPASAAVGFLVCFAALPKVGATAVTRGRASRARIQENALELASVLGKELRDTNVVSSPLPAARPLSPDELRRLLQAMAQGTPGSYQTNRFTGERIRFEASPGNIILRPAVPVPHALDSLGHPLAGGYDLVWHDLDGAEAITNAVPW